jgi:hypothetical protein
MINELEDELNRGPTKIAYRSKPVSLSLILACMSYNSQTLAEYQP